MRKIIIVNLVVIIILVGVFEFVSRLLDQRAINHLPPVPGNSEGFGDFQGFVRYVQEFARVEAYITGGYSNIFEPYTATLLKPNYVCRVRNINYTINSLGLRSQEPMKPKPANTFRVVTLGGSTVEGGFNDKWIIAPYLDRELKKHYQGVEVINGGIVGYSSQEELALLQTKILDLHPDLVVVLDGRNDLYYSILDTWRNHEGDPYNYCKRALDGLINYPTFFTLSANLARFLTKKSSAITRIFRFFFRQKQEAIYPHQVRFKELAVTTYLGNLRLIKAALEVNGIPGIIAFQPTMGYGKNHPTAYEKSVASYLQEYEKSDWLSQIPPMWPRLGRQVAAIAPTGPVRSYDLSRIFAETRETAYIDSCHYSPEGCEILGVRLAGLIRTDFGGYFAKFARQPLSGAAAVKGKETR